MQKDDLVRLRHMLDAARDAVSFVRHERRRNLEKDRKLVLALVKCVEIMGEAAAHLTDGCHKKFPEIPWVSIIGMRNRLIHAYFDTNLNILWKTITDDLPPLIVELEKITPPAEKK